MLAKQSCCRQKQIGSILKVSMVVVRTCIDKQLACKLFLFTKAGANSILISSWEHTNWLCSHCNRFFIYRFGYEHYKDVASISLLLY